MTTPKTAELADALAAQLIALGFTEATRAYLPAYNLTDLATRKITVQPIGDERTPTSRATNGQIHTLAIILQVQADPSDNQAIDALLAAADAIKDEYERGGSLRDLALAGCKWRSIKQEPYFRPDHLDEHHLASTALTLTYSRTTT